MKKLILLITLLISMPVYSGDIIVHTFTSHVGVSDLEDFTPGVGYTNDANYRFGVLRNSYKVPSFYVVKMFPENKRFRFGLGAVSGYEYSKGMLSKKERGIIPLMAAEVDLTKNTTVIWFGQALSLAFKFKI